MIEWSQKSFEWVSVHWYEGTFCLGNNVGSSWFVLEKSSLTKEVTDFIFHYLFSFFTSIEYLSGNTLSLHEKEKVITLITFFDNKVSCLILMILKGIGQLRSLVWLHGGQNWNLTQKCIILFSLFACWILDNMIKGLSVESPQNAVSIRSNCGSSWGVIQQSKFSESLSFFVCLEHSWLSVSWEYFCASKGSWLYNV